MLLEYTVKVLNHFTRFLARNGELYLIVHYDTSAMKRFLTSDVITLVKKTSHEYRTKFYITSCENAVLRTRSVRKSAFTHSE